MSRWRRPLVFAGIAFLVSRVLTEAVALAAAYHTHALTMVLHDPSVTLAPWLRFDAIFHLEIAAQGYPLDQEGLVVFPPLPWLLVGALSSAAHIPVLASGLLVNAIAEGAALVLLFKLAELDLDAAAARWTVVLLLAYPSALFLTAPYAEPAMLLCGAGAFLAARRGHWWVTGILIALATLCKLFAIVFVVPLLMEYVRDRGLSWREVARAVLVIVLPPVIAVASWFAYVGHRFGDPLLPVTNEQLWGTEPTSGGQLQVGRHLAPPWVSIAGAVQTVFGRHLVSSFDLLALVLILVAAVYCWLRVRRSYGVLLVLCALSFTVSTILQSTSRYALVCFPLFIAAAHLTRRYRVFGYLWIAAGVLLQVVLIARFATGAYAG